MACSCPPEAAGGKIRAWPALEGCRGQHQDSQRVGSPPLAGDRDFLQVLNFALSVEV